MAVETAVLGRKRRDQIVARGKWMTWSVFFATTTITKGRGWSGIPRQSEAHPQVHPQRDMERGREGNSSVHTVSLRRERRVRVAALEGKDEQSARLAI